MAIKAWIRVSTEKQDRDNQRHAILEYCNTKQWHIDSNDWFEFTVSTRRKELKDYIHQMVESMAAGDTLIVSELSRLGRSMRQMLNMIHDLHHRHVTIIALKERLDLPGGDTMSIQSEIMITMFGLLYQLERRLISLRTKEALAAKKKNGTKLGRPRGNGTSKLNGKESYIQELLKKRVSKASIAKIMEVAPSTLTHFIKTRGLHNGDNRTVGHQCGRHVAEETGASAGYPANPLHVENLCD
jgi:DNA invertase Pin-like site-specific DNA recombinase